MLQKMSSTAVVMGAAACGALMGPAAEAAPVVSIAGLDGAEHWVWQEGEDDYGSNSAGAGSFRDNNGISGWMENGPANAYRRASGSNPVRTASWTLHAPAAMSSDAKLFARASIDRADVGMTVTFGTTVVADRMLESGQTNPTVFLEHKFNGESVGQGVPVGALAAGNHNVSYAAESDTIQGFRSFMVDGLLLYDGTPILPSVSTDTRRWLRNPTSADSPELLGPVTPILDVTGLVNGNVVQYILNGSTYTPGTEIGAGDHELVVAVFADSTATSKRLAFAGANFSIVPEPASMALLAIGAATLLPRRRSAGA